MPNSTSASEPTDDSGRAPRGRVKSARASAAAPRRTRRAVSRAQAEVGDVFSEALDVTERIGEFGHAVAQRVRATAGDTARRLLEGDAERQRRLRALNRQPLPNLFDLHPHARSVPRRELGLRTIPVEEIRGTAVEGPAQRGRDFVPLPAFRSENWKGRWQRIRRAQDQLAILPPIDVLETADGYWVLDGHNRVAAALYGGQPDIDAVVARVHLPGQQPAEVASASLAPMLAEGEDLRAAASGRLSPGTSLEDRVRDPATYKRVVDTLEYGPADEGAGRDEPQQ